MFGLIRERRENGKYVVSVHRYVKPDNDDNMPPAFPELDKKRYAWTEQEMRAWAAKGLVICGLSDTEINVYSTLREYVEVETVKGQLFGSSFWKYVLYDSRGKIVTDKAKWDKATYFGVQLDIGSYSVEELATITELDLPDGALVCTQDSVLQNLPNVKSFDVTDSLEHIDELLRHLPNLQTLRLPASMCAVPERLCFGMTNLRSVKLHENVKSIGSSAFYGCASLTHIELPDSMEEFGSTAFQGCSSLSSIRFGKKVKMLGFGCFTGCAFKEIEIPPLDCYAFDCFSGCKNLKRVRIHTSDEVSPPTVLNYIPVEKYGMFGKSCESLETAIVVGEGKGLPAWLFANTESLKVLDMSNNKLADIPDNFCNNCSSLRMVRLPQSLRSIGETAFNGCSDLQSLVLPEGLEKLGRAAFCRTGIRELTIPSTVTDMDSETFVGMNLTNLVFVGYVENPMFLAKLTQLNEVEFRGGLGFLDWGVFRDCKYLTKFRIPKGVGDISGFISSTSIQVLYVPDAETYAMVQRTGVERTTIRVVKEYEE